MSWTFEEMEKVKQAINEKARIDKEFRSLCLENSREAVEQISEKVVPEGFHIRFVENEGAHLTHVLPDYLPPSASELSEEELEQVSAGARIKNADGTSTWVCHWCGSRKLQISGQAYHCMDCGYFSKSLMDD